LLPGPAGRAVRRSRLRREVRRCARHATPPVLVYTMSKVASSAVTEALQSSGLNVFQIHVISAAGVRRIRAGMRARGLTGARAEVNNLADLAHAVREELIKPGRPAKIVTLVREPVARNVSFYFQILDDLWQTRAAHENVPLARLLAEYHDRFSHERSLNWFDEEFKPSLGIDVYEHPFPREAGFRRIDSGAYEVLVMRHDLDDRRKEEILADFAGVPRVSLAPRNVGAEKPYAAVYREFLRRVRLPEAYVDRMLGSRYARHFYTPEELARVREKWLGGRAEYV
ncbi:MAG TPA: putative capsular polysaccharide synthesis family protein, partial [Pyrinomonadaceae bacterium]